MNNDDKMSWGAALFFVVSLAFVGAGAYFFIQKSDVAVPVKEESIVPIPKQALEKNTDVREPDAQLVKKADEKEEVIGTSAGGTAITAYHFGDAEGKEILIIGGVHGGYAPNTSALAQEFITYLADFTTKGIRVTVIPTLNPDGMSKAGATAGRFNANNVDLNRNFACDWKTSGVWKNTEVSGGAVAFSEPETKAVRDYVAIHTPSLVLAYYAAAGGVFASNCHTDVLPETTSATNAYAKASGYKVHTSFDPFELTGDMMNWFASEKIPAMSVYLTDHIDTEWIKNKAGFEAVLEQYAQ